MARSSPLGLSRGSRALCAAGAGIVSLTLCGGLAGLWQAGAEPLWLAATPAVAAQLAQCEQAPSRAARQQCKQQYVAARLAPEPPAVRVAGR